MTTTSNITGIDIRKAIIAEGLRPSSYDEQGIFNYLTKHWVDMPTQERFQRMLPRFKVA